MVMEHSTLQTAVTPRSERLALKEHGAIPKHFRIYVANHNSKHKSGAVRNSHTVALSTDGPSPPLDGTDKNAQTISLLIGKLFIHLNSVRLNGLDIESRYFISRVWDECRIWPDPNCSLSWPHRPLLDDKGLFKVGNALETLVSAHMGAGKAVWIDDFP